MSRKIQFLNMTLGIALVGCTTGNHNLPVYSECPTYQSYPIEYDVQWPELRFRYPPDPDHPIELEELLYEDWHIMKGFPEIWNWDYCQLFFENQGLEVHYTNNLIYMRQRR